MHNFTQYWTIPLGPILKELNQSRDKWTGFEAKYRAFLDTKKIWLRARIDEPWKRTSECHDTQWTKNAKHFPCTLAILESLAAEFDGELWVVFFVKIPSGNIVLPHIDVWSYHKIRDRYHIVIESTGSDLFVGDEHAVFHAWDFFSFDNKVIHHSENNTDIERIHLIFDFLPRHTEDKDKYKKRLIYTKIQQLKALKTHFWENITWNLDR